MSSVNINDIARKYVRQWYFLFLMGEYAPTDMALLYFSSKGKNQIVTQTLIIQNHLVSLSLRQGQEVQSFCADLLKDPPKSATTKTVGEKV